MLLWLDQLTLRVITHIEASHSTGWTCSKMPRGAYFFRYSMREQFPVITDRTAFHLVINNYYLRDPILHCAAKLEPNPPANVPGAITNLFQGNNMQAGRAGGGLEIGVVDIRIPQDFQIESALQNLPPQLWTQILTRFLLSERINTFLNACAA